MSDVETTRPWLASGHVAYIDGVCRVHGAPTYTELAEAIRDLDDLRRERDEWRSIAIQLATAMRALNLRQSLGDGDLDLQAKTDAGYTLEVFDEANSRFVNRENSGSVQDK